MLSINRGQSCTIAIRLSNPLLRNDIENIQCIHSSGSPWFQPTPFWEDGVAFIRLSAQDTLTIQDSFFIYFVIQSSTKGQRITKRIPVKAFTVHTPGTTVVNQDIDFVLEFIDPEYRGIEAWVAGYVKGESGQKGEKGDRGEVGQKGQKGSSIVRVDIAGDNLVFFFDGGIPPQSALVPAIVAANQAAAAALASQQDANASKLSAAQSALEAQGYAVSAANSEASALDSASTATQQAILAENARIATDQKAAEVLVSASEALTSRNEALGFRDDAQVSATNAANSEFNASRSADDAEDAKDQVLQAKSSVEQTAIQASQSAQLASDKAAQANASALDAIDSASEAADSAAAANQSAIDANTSAIDANTYSGIANSASQTAVGASQSAELFALQAGISKDEAESAATLSTEQATLASSARNEAVAAKIAAENSEDTAVGAATTASAAATTATTQAGVATVAAASINQINFTGAQDNDLLMRQIGVFSRVTPANLGAIRELFRLAIPLNSYFNVKQIVAWDNSDKTVPNGSALTTLDSGQSWQPFIGPHTIAYRGSSDPNRRLFRGTSTNALDNWSSVIAWGLGSIGIEWTHKRSIFGADSGVIIAAKDTSNFLIFERFMPSGFTGGLAAGGNHRLISVVNGVGTAIASFAQGQIFGETGSNDAFSMVDITWVIQYAHIGSGNASRILIFLKHNPSFRIEVDVTSLNSVYTNAADIVFTGICGDSLIEGATSRIIFAKLK